MTMGVEQNYLERKKTKRQTNNILFHNNNILNDYKSTIYRVF